MSSRASVPTRSPAPDGVLVVAAIGAVAVAVALLRLIPGVNPTTAGFVFLILVLLAATLGPLWIAITVAVASTLSFNYFFFPPVGTFTIAEPHNWIALFAFLVAAVIASNLSAAAQARAREAIARRNEVTRLFDLTRDVLLTTRNERRDRRAGPARRPALRAAARRDLPAGRSRLVDPSRRQPSRWRSMRTS